MAFAAARRARAGALTSARVPGRTGRIVIGRAADERGDGGRSGGPVAAKRGHQTVAEGVEVASAQATHIHNTHTHCQLFTCPAPCAQAAALHKQAVADLRGPRAHAAAPVQLTLALRGDARWPDAAAAALRATLPVCRRLQALRVRGMAPGQEAALLVEWERLAGGAPTEARRVSGGWLRLARQPGANAARLADLEEALAALLVTSPQRVGLQPLPKRWAPPPPPRRRDASPPGLDGAGLGWGRSHSLDPGTRALPPHFVPRADQAGV